MLMLMLIAIYAEILYVPKRALQECSSGVGSTSFACPLCSTTPAKISFYSPGTPVFYMYVCIVIKKRESCCVPPRYMVLLLYTLPVVITVVPLSLSRGRILPRWACKVIPFSTILHVCLQYVL
jgi:hypothetical protein